MFVVVSPESGVVCVTAINSGSRLHGQSTARGAKGVVRQDGAITCLRYCLALGHIEDFGHCLQSNENLSGGFNLGGKICFFERSYKLQCGFERCLDCDGNQRSLKCTCER